MTTPDEPAVTKTAEQEFEVFFVEHFESIVNSLTVITGDRHRATDAVQEAFIKAYARWSRVRRREAPALWVRRVAINASRDMHRSDQRRARREVATSPSSSASTDDVLVAQDSARQMLSALPQRQCEVATLFYVDDLSIDDIAAILGLRPGTVKSHLSAARDRLRDLVRTEAPHE